MSTFENIRFTVFTKQPHPCDGCFNKNKREKEETSPTLSTDDSQQENCTKKTKLMLNESESLQQYRVRSLSNWPHALPSNESMTSAGWFSCNTGDRVICIYCNTICHRWMVNDDPAEVHRRLAPQCPFILLIPSVGRSPKVINDSLDEHFEPFHRGMVEQFRREETFSTDNWSMTSPSVESFTRAGFFFSGVPNTVTCFYCNGSLQKWGSKDNPMIEHARWFPQCTYAKHLCGNHLYAKIQASKKKMSSENKLDETEINRQVNARMDLPAVQRLCERYSRSIIKRCLFDQFRLRNDDFKSDTDLTIACSILQKQVDLIQGCTDNIVIPSKHQAVETSRPAKQSFGACLICLSEEKAMACMPCGHFCACVPCGYALRSCPICRQKVQCFMRIES